MLEQRISTVSFSLSIEKDSFADLVCRKYRWKFDIWAKKIKDDFNDLTASNDLEKAMVNIYFSNSYL